MNETLAIMQVIDAQLSILNIEGWKSEHQIFRDFETVVNFELVQCSLCKGAGEIFYEDEWSLYDDFTTCPECDGYGKVENTIEKVVSYEESWTISNIVI
jgi:hypothetical protein